MLKETKNQIYFLEGTMKKNKELEKYLDEIVRSVLDLYSINEDDNLSFKPKDWGAILRYQNILSYVLLKTEKFEQKFDDARYWFPFPKNPMTDISIDTIIHQMKFENEASFEKCKLLFENKLSDAKREILQDFDLYFLLDIDPDANFIPFSVSLCDRSIDFFITNPTKEPFSSPFFAVKLNFINDRRKTKYSTNNSVCLHIQIPARNQFYAMKEGIQSAQFILCWIGLMNNWNSGQTYTFDFPHSYENCPSLALLLVGNQEKNCVGELIWKVEGKKKKCPIQIEALRKNLNRYSNGTIESQKIVQAALNAYFTGLHEDDMGYSLLAFWATIERLCLQDNKLSHTKMLNRLYFLVSPISKIEINVLLELRNKAVHQWDYDVICEHERHLMKIYSDLLLDFFMKHLMSFNQNEIKLFYSNINCHYRQLKDLEKSNYKVFHLIKEIRPSKN